MITWLFIASLPQFLLDQRSNQHDVPALIASKTPVVVIAGNERKSAEAVLEWLRVFPVPRPFKVYALVDMRRVPFFVPKSIIRSRVVEVLPNTPMLFDLDGAASDALALPKGAAHVVVFREGKALGTVMGPASEDKVPDVVRLLAKDGAL